MKILVGVFTWDRNIRIFAKCLDYLLLARAVALEKFDAQIDILIRDFSGQGNTLSRFLNNIDLPCIKLVNAPGTGFGRNFNACKFTAISKEYDYFININDDAFIHKDFILESIKFLEKHTKAGFVGGASNLGAWLLSPDDVDIPEPKGGSVPIVEFGRLWWEASACCYRVSAIKEIGDFDEFLSGKTGYLADNEYLLRLSLAGWKLYRSNKMTFFHIKGQTQSLYRTPGMRKDIIRERGTNYLILKWNLHIEKEGPQEYFSQPFNGKEMEILHNNKITLNGEEFALVRGE